MFHSSKNIILNEDILYKKYNLYNSENINKSNLLEYEKIENNDLLKNIKIYLSTENVSVEIFNIFKSFGDERKINLKLKLINNYNLNIFTTLLHKFYLKFVKDEFQYITYNDIFKSVINYFNLQKKNDIIKNKHVLKSIIEIQHLITKYYTKLLGELTSDDKNINFSDIDPIISIENEENNKINNLITKYINNIKLKLKNEKQKQQINTEDNNLINKLHNIIVKIIKNILIKYNNNTICYGSYTGYNLNSKIEYKDIDIYHTQAFQFLVCLMVTLSFTTNVNNINIFSIPYISNHMALRYKNYFILDCIYLDKNILDKIPKITINNINFIDPGIQMLNNIRMSMEIFRLNKINKDKENTIIKYSTLLSFFINNNNLDINNSLNIYNNIDLIEKIYSVCEFFGTYLIIHLDKLFDLSKYKSIDTFDKLFIIFSSPNDFISYVKNKNGKFSRRFYAFLDELFFEYSPTDIENIGGSNISNISTLEINESKLINKNSILTYSNLENNFEYNKNYKILFFTNLSTSLYYKKNNDIYEISLRNIQSIFATFILYSFLHSRNEIAIDIYKFLISTLVLKHENLENYMRKMRYKKEGLHIEINLSKNIYKAIKKNQTIPSDFLSFNEIEKYLIY